MIYGYRRQNGLVGARNHVLVLPSVVCSGRAAEMIAKNEAVAITHQHGCAVAGEDAEHTAAIFSGIATNPNVGGVLVVGLGCETIQGTSLAHRISESGQRVSYVGVQAEGGTERTIVQGRRALAALRSGIAESMREPSATEHLTIGLDDANAPFADVLCEQARRSGARVVVAERARGPEAHPELASAGAQVVIAWCGPGEAPRGFAVCPVISVSGDVELFEALKGDFELVFEGSHSLESFVSSLWDIVLRVFDGCLTAAEDRGANDFSLRRLARSL